jgi:hypothetical protein
MRSEIDLRVLADDGGFVTVTITGMADADRLVERVDDAISGEFADDDDVVIERSGD